MNIFKISHRTFFVFHNEIFETVCHCWLITEEKRQNTLKKRENIFVSFYISIKYFRIMEIFGKEKEQDNFFI